ncbi:MAG: M48 family metalloprotease [Bryobacteraceae bacterium]|nr:M48 family metalloprotease [Bryobacteraceae bacterium]
MSQTPFPAASRGWRRAVSLATSLALMVSPAAAQSGRAQLAPEVRQALRQALLKSYAELFEEAPRLEFSASQIAAMRKILEDAQKNCSANFRRRADDLGRQLRDEQNRLRADTARIDDAERKKRHCSIQNLRALESQARVLAEHAIPVAYENRKAKLELIEKWPAELKQIQADIASGAHLKRKWGDVKDIGFRELVPDQEKDIKTGQDAVREMKMAGLMPPEVDNPVVKKYVTSLAQRIGRHSDLRVPLNVSVLNSKEVNAFALPGGFLFIQRGLLEAAENEAQLAGVIAHEIAHVTGRHGHRLMKRATISSIIYQAAQVAALILTGGAATIGTYYALQYGFYGLGLVLSLDLLGVSREMELEADQLGVQYAWNAGFDPNGFIHFFDKMATREGYVNGLSWFRTHPPFYERMVQSRKEILFLPPKEGLAVNSAEFEQMKAELKKVTAQAEEEEKDRPSLLAPVQGCPAPEKIEYKPGEPIEKLCPEPGESSSGAR